MPEISDDRLEELEGAEEWMNYLTVEIEGLVDSLDEHVTIGDVYEALEGLMTHIYNGGRPPGSLAV